MILCVCTLPVWVFLFFFHACVVTHLCSVKHALPRQSCCAQTASVIERCYTRSVEQDTILSSQFIRHISLKLTESSRTLQRYTQLLHVYYMSMSRHSREAINFQNNTTYGDPFDLKKEPHINIIKTCLHSQLYTFIVSRSVST